MECYQMPHAIKKDGKTNIICSSLCCCLQTVRQMDRKRCSKRRKCWKCERSGAFQWHLCGFGVLFCCLNVCARITCTLEIRTYFAICLRDSLSFPPLSTVIRFNVPKLVVRIVNFACVRALLHEPLSTLQLEYKYALKCDKYVAHSECIVESNWNLQRKLRAICQDKNANKHMPSVIWTTSVVSIFWFFCVRDH